MKSQKATGCLLERKTSNYGNREQSAAEDEKNSETKQTNIHVKIKK